MTASDANILVIDDDQVVGQLHVCFLAKAGYTAHYASSHYEALTALSGNLFDIVFLDLYMPEKDGWEFLPALRQRWSAEMLKILMLTVDDSEGVHESLLKLGADDFITKPISPTKLVAKATQWLAPQKTLCVDRQIQI